MQAPCFGVETTAVRISARLWRDQTSARPLRVRGVARLRGRPDLLLLRGPGGAPAYVAADVPRPATRRSLARRLGHVLHETNALYAQSREDSAKSRYTITPPPPDYTDDAEGMRWYPCDRADESIARPIPGTAQREIVARRRRASAATGGKRPPGAHVDRRAAGAVACGRRALRPDHRRVPGDAVETASRSTLWRCLRCSTDNEPVVDRCRLCRAGRMRVSLAIAS